MRVAADFLGVNGRWVRGYHLWEAVFHPVEKLYTLRSADKGDEIGSIYSILALTPDHERGVRVVVFGDNELKCHGKLSNSKTWVVKSRTGNREPWRRK